MPLFVAGVDVVQPPNDDHYENPARHALIVVNDDTSDAWISLREKLSQVEGEDRINTPVPSGLLELYKDHEMLDTEEVYEQLEDINLHEAPSGIATRELLGISGVKPQHVLDLRLEGNGEWFYLQFQAGDGFPMVSCESKTIYWAQMGLPNRPGDEDTLAKIEEASQGGVKFAHVWNPRMKETTELQARLEAERHAGMEVLFEVQDDGIRCLNCQNVDDRLLRYVASMAESVCSQCHARGLIKQA